MRSGVCTVQLALTDEVASVLKLSVNLARRRDHAQVTPLHVAAILISTSSATAEVLSRACLKSQPHHPATHPLRCRALELCFNVALNRLPTTAPLSSVSFLPSPSSLSNSLIAALKRAQANQRRGCIELQQLQPLPLFAIKVEMEQLMLSILDDPSVSRVMKEAGFSSSCVKSNLEEESSTLSQSSPFLLDSSKNITNASREMWQCPLLGLASKVSVSEDLTSVIGTMISKQGRKANTVVVGDSISMTEGLVAELKRRLQRNEVPDELMHASFINLQFSAHPRLMSKGEVDMKVADLRKVINSLTSFGVGLIIYAGDLSWAVNEEPIDGSGFNYDPVEHIVTEMGNIFSEFKSSINNRVWLLATSSYSTYRKCLIKRPCLVTLWALQAVVVPSGWLGLGLQASSYLNSKVSTFVESPFQLLQSKVDSSKKHEKLLCCDECTFNFEKEALVFKSEIPCWLQANSQSNQKEALPELNSGWPNSMFSNQNKSFIESQSFSFPSTIQNVYPGFSVVDKKNEVGNSSEGSISSLKMSVNHQVKATLALSSPLFSDSATSKETRLLMADPIALRCQLQEEVPWQSNSTPSIMEALHECVSGVNTAMMLLVEGNDCVAKRRLASVVAKSFFGFKDKIISIKPNGSFCATATLLDALRKDTKCVVLIEDFCQMNADFIESFTDAIKIGTLKGKLGEEASLADAIFILTTSKCSNLKDAHDINNVVAMKLCDHNTSSSYDAKRKSESDVGSLSKKPRKEEHSFDLNFKVNSDIEEDAAPSDLTQEAEFNSLHLPQELLNSTVQLTLNACYGQYHEVKVNLLLKLHRAFDEVQNAKDEKWQLFIDPEVAEELMQASGLFLESFFEKWVREILQPSLLTAQRCGNLRLRLEGEERRNIEEFGFMASVLPNKINMELCCNP